jgi:hypothetical protein
MSPLFINSKDTILQHGNFFRDVACCGEREDGSGGASIGGFGSNDEARQVGENVYRLEELASSYPPEETYFEVKAVDDDVDDDYFSSLQTRLELRPLTSTTRVDIAEALASYFNKEGAVGLNTKKKVLEFAHMFLIEESEARNGTYFDETDDDFVHEWLGDMDNDIVNQTARTIQWYFSLANALSRCFGMDIVLLLPPDGNKVASGTRLFHFPDDDYYASGTILLRAIIDRSLDTSESRGDGGCNVVGVMAYSYTNSAAAAAAADSSAGVEVCDIVLEDPDYEDEPKRKSGGGTSSEPKDKKRSKVKFSAAKEAGLEHNSEEVGLSASAYVTPIQDMTEREEPNLMQSTKLHFGEETQDSQQIDTLKKDSPESDSRKHSNSVKEKGDPKGESKSYVYAGITSCISLSHLM